MIFCRLAVFMFCLITLGWSDRACAQTSPPPPTGPAVRTDSFAATRAGAERTLAGITLCWCPQGKFLMGSPSSEPGRRPDEAQVEVTLSSGFWLGKFEVTQRQWLRFGPIPRELIAGRGDNFPVYWVSYVAAEDYCRWLTATARAAGELPAGWEFRIPTEAQWEYACRAGTTTAFAFGDQLTNRHANIGRPYRGAPPGFPDGSATAVGSYPPNAWGPRCQWCCIDYNQNW